MGQGYAKRHQKTLHFSSIISALSDLFTVTSSLTLTIYIKMTVNWIFLSTALIAHYLFFFCLIHLCLSMVHFLQLKTCIRLSYPIIGTSSPCLTRIIQYFSSTVAAFAPHLISKVSWVFKKIIFFLKNMKNSSAFSDTWEWIRSLEHSILFSWWKERKISSRSCET